MSSVNYSLNHKGVRLITTDEAFVKTNDGKFKLNSNYNFVGKIDADLPNLIITTSDKKKPGYKGDTVNLNRTAKKQLVNLFYDEYGKRNKRRVAYLVVKK